MRDSGAWAASTGAPSCVAEAVWWRCHRRIITDYLLSEGERVMHILGTAHIDEASLTPSAKVRRDGTIIYPAESPHSE